MIRQALSQFPMPVLTCMALLLFFAVFVGIFIHAYFLTSSEQAAELALLALDQKQQQEMNT